MRVIYLDTALTDMKEVKYYLDQFSPTAGEKVLELLEKRTKSLEQFPYMGEKYKNYRRLVCDDYLIFYQVNEEKNTVEVVRFLHGKLDIATRFSGN